MSTNEWLNRLNEKSVWLITKQNIDFEEAFNAARLFSEIPNKEEINIEEYFAKNYKKYNISTDRHRILVISQYYGLITKSPFYSRGGTYNNENVTAVFEKIAKTKVGSKEYNTLKSEQLLKLKIHSIIDTANNNQGYQVLPIVFIYEVLRRLEDEYGISEVNLDYLYTYVMTCSSYNEIDIAVEYIKDKAQTTEYVNRYKDLSRVLTSIKRNTNLFNITDNTISLNKEFDVYFYHNFIEKFDLEDLHSQLSRDVDYAYFLTNVQGFDINLIDTPSEFVEPYVGEKKPIGISVTEDDDGTYQDKVDNIKESNINIDSGKDSYKNSPVQSSKEKRGRKFKTNPMLGKIAIKRAYYSCEIDETHKTFISRRTQKSFMEAHHLVPVNSSLQIWDKYNINVDCVENIFSLCPNCHRAIHNGNDEIRMEKLKILFKKAIPRYKEIGLNITFEEICELYNK